MVLEKIFQRFLFSNGNVHPSIFPRKTPESKFDLAVKKINVKQKSAFEKILDEIEYLIQHIEFEGNRSIDSGRKYLITIQGRGGHVCHMTER